MSFHSTYKGLKPPLLQFFIIQIRHFPLYLQGIETRLKQHFICGRNNFPLYLQGIETSSFRKQSTILCFFPLYLQGIETILCDNRLTGKNHPFPLYLQGIETPQHIWIKCKRQKPFHSTYKGLKQHA